MIDVKRLVLRRDNPDGMSQHRSDFVWPSSGFVGIRPDEQVVRDRQCGSGLYGYSCDRFAAHRMTLDWRGSVWRLIQAVHDPIDLGQKVKYEAGHVLFAGTAQECRDLIWELGGDVPAACLGVDPDERRPGFDKCAIAHAIREGQARRSQDAGLWRIFRAIGAAGSPAALRARNTRQWIAFGVPEHDARYMTGEPSAGAAAAWRAGWVWSYDRHDLQILALAGWTHARTAWLHNPTDPKIREWLLAHPNATETQVRAFALAAERLPVRLASASGLLDARRMYAAAENETIKAVCVSRKPRDASVIRSEDRPIGLYVGAIGARAPDCWISRETLARLVKRSPTLTVRSWNWTREKAKIDARNAKRRLVTRKRQERELARARVAERKLETKRDQLIQKLEIKDGPKSWGRTTCWKVRLAGTEASWRTISWYPNSASLVAVLALVHECALTAGDRHV